MCKNNKQQPYTGIKSFPLIKYNIYKYSDYMIVLLQHHKGILVLQTLACKINMDAYIHTDIQDIWLFKNAYIQTFNLFDYLRNNSKLDCLSSVLCIYQDYHEYISVVRVFRLHKGGGGGYTYPTSIQLICLSNVFDDMLTLSNLCEIGEQVKSEVNLRETFDSVNTLNTTQNQLYKTALLYTPYIKKFLPHNLLRV